MQALSAEPVASGASPEAPGGALRMRVDRFRRFARSYWVDIAWVVFVGLNLIAMRLLPAWQTVPFLIIWVSLTTIYGFRLWRLGSTVLMVAVVTLSPGTLIGRGAVFFLALLGLYLGSIDVQQNVGKGRKLAFRRRDYLRYSGRPLATRLRFLGFVDITEELVDPVRHPQDFILKEVARDLRDALPIE